MELDLNKDFLIRMAKKRDAALIVKYIRDLAAFEYRGNPVGFAFFHQSHDWNAPAIALYKKWGAFPIENIRVYRLCGEALNHAVDFNCRKQHSG